MSALRVHVDGVGLWAAHWLHFDALRAQLAGRAIPPAEHARPAAERLPANERRRAPESVLLAIEVAGQAIDMSGADQTQLACVFASAHGDHVITDYMCTTLARAPTELSPTRFHNSVHNAPVGYWTIAIGCHAPSTAICSGHTSFCGALLEAATQVEADRRPVLLVCSDIAGTGALNELTDCRQSFGCALVLSPQQSKHSIATLQLRVTAGETAATTRPSATLPEWYTDNASARALPLLTLLATDGGRAALALSPSMHLDVHTEIIQ
jgi:Beta-ketoacyl synthase, N-terminal domain